MTEADQDTGADIQRTGDGIEYTPHTMIHKAVVRMDPTKLEMLEDFDRTDVGHKFTPTDSNVRVIITGRDWKEESILVYGSKSSDEARLYVDMVIDRITEIGHEAEITSEPKIVNIAVSGDFGSSLYLEDLAVGLKNRDVDVEYEPEQFPAAIVRIDSPPVTFLLFSTGKFVIQGLQKTEDIEPAIERIQTDLKDLKAFD